MLTKKLTPILVYEDPCLYQSSPPKEYPANIKTTSLTSQGRLTTTCIFTQFLGPSIDSKQIITLSPGNEAIFCKLPDYKIKMKWTLKGCAKIWTINSKRTEAFQVYSVSGDLLELNTHRGCAEIYSFNFPIVVELSQGGRIDIELTLGEHLLPQIDPLSLGKKCLTRNREQIYTNIPNGETFLMDRVIVSKYRDEVARLRRNYLSVFRLPCRPQGELTLPIDVQTITIDSRPTIVNYVASFGAAFLVSAECYAPLWCTLNSNTSSPLQLTDTIGLNVSGLASYAYVSQSGVMRFTIDVVMVYADELNRVDFGCGSWYVGFGIYSRNELLKLTDGNNSSIGAQLEGNNAIFKQTFDVVVKEKQYLWFGGYGLSANSRFPLTLISINGTITCQYV
jgi:hypothetical protein